MRFRLLALFWLTTVAAAMLASWRIMPHVGIWSLGWGGAICYWLAWRAYRFDMSVVAATFRLYFGTLLLIAAFGTFVILSVFGGLKTP